MRAEIEVNSDTGLAGGSAAAEAVLEIAGLQAWYGESHILHGVDLRVNRGEVVTLLGRNGAGRTTTMRAIMGLTGRRTGSIKINGRETVGLRRRLLSGRAGHFFQPVVRREFDVAAGGFATSQTHVDRRNLRHVPEFARAPPEPGYAPVGR